MHLNMAAQVQPQVPVPQQQVSGGQQQPQPQQQGDIDPISKFKILLPRLKESLVVSNYSALWHICGLHK